ncbi:hypothetical protein F5I97DRAFT_2066612 [Phlebopus sp. FC_14]|nr:hypothetical protein F5I97DRAFT_2066612 [Phlebopus sp. FC_14]
MQARSLSLRLGDSSLKPLARGNIRSISWFIRRLHVERPRNSPSSLPVGIRSPSFFTHSRWVSSQPPLPDPSRPDLFYHLTSLPHPSDSSQSTPVYALSFLQSPPPSDRSPTIIGWLPAVVVGEHKDVDAGLNDFVENPRFRCLLHKAIKEALHEGADDVWKNGALQLQRGWMHIHGLFGLPSITCSCTYTPSSIDNRNVPALGRIGDPDDIIASVLVEDSKILPDTYQAMPSYRICTSDGPIQLTEGLAKKLKSVLEDAASCEPC